jgi:hypothetical protein
VPKKNKEAQLLKSLSVILNAYQDIEDVLVQTRMVPPWAYAKISRANLKIGKELRKLLPE